jgi:hypothetical protein
LRGLKKVLRPATKRIFGPVARSKNDYATHIPILLSIAQAIRVEKVLELGCGEYSTLTFLNTRAFPSLVTLDSVETDEAWLDKISASAGSDPRLHPRLVSGTMRAAIEKIDLDCYDLIFVDDSATTEERCETIREISHRKPHRPLVAIHDFEIEGYRSSAGSFERKFLFRTFNPETGLVWNGERNLTPTLKRHRVLLRQNAKLLEPDDVVGWQNVLESFSMSKAV